jgi:hypothetical protein
LAILSKEALLGASDLVEREVELPSIGGSVRVRSLPAAYSNEATSEALELVTGRRGEQTAKVNTAKLEILQVLHGLVDPKLASMHEAEVFAQQCGPAFKEIVRVIDEISGIDKKSLEDTEVRFPAGGEAPSGSDLGDGAAVGNGRSDLPVRTGA